MDYNSTREKLIMPEYGRNIQQMVRHAMTIEDREERNRCARTIINIMGNLFPYLRDVADFKHKLWDHLAIMSDYQLDIDSPYPMPKRENIESHPEPLPYSNHNIKLKHYGHIVEALIEKAVSTTDPEEKQQLVESIANYMKKALLANNKDITTDDRLFSDIVKLSGGRLQVEEGTKTASIQEARPYFQRNQRNNHQRNNNNNQRNNHQRNNNQRNNHQRNNNNRNNF